MPSELTSQSKVSFDGATTSPKAPQHKCSVPSGMRMQMTKEPPGRQSISASGTSTPSGLNQRFIRSALVQHWKTCSRGAAKTREMVSDRGVAALASVMVVILASLRLQLFEVAAEPVETALPFGALGVEPGLGAVERRRLEAALPDAADLL